MSIGLNTSRLYDLYSANEGTFNQKRENLKNERPNLYTCWEAIHQQYAFDDITSLDRSRLAIEGIVRHALELLDTAKKNLIYGELYAQIKPITDDAQWGEHHAFENMPVLIPIVERYISTEVSSYPEKTSINDDKIWHNEQGLSEPSCQYILENRCPLLPGRAIGYINGVSTPFNQAKWDAYRISDNICSKYNIEGVWSATHGRWFDLMLTLRLYAGALPEPVGLLLKQWNNFFDSNDSNAHYLQICFSQGVAVVKNALELLSPDRKSRVDIIAIAPAAFIGFQSGRQLRHFVKKEDFVPMYIAPHNNRLTQSDDPEICILPHDGNSDAHDPLGAEYVNAIKPYVDCYLKTGSILENNK